MNKRKIILIGGLIVALAVISATVSFAAAQNNRIRARAQVRLARLIGVRAFVNKLNLTADQKTQIKSILQNSKAQMQQAARNVIKARLDLARGDDGAVSELAAAQSQAVNLRKQIFESIRPVLTPDQLSKMQQLQQLREQRLQRILDRLDGKIGG